MVGSEESTHSGVYLIPQVLGTYRLVAFDRSAALISANSGSTPAVVLRVEMRVSTLCCSSVFTMESKLL